MYLNLIQIAESFGVSESTVEGWIRDESMPHTPDRGRILFDRSQVAQWAAARGLASRAGFLTLESPALAGGCQLEPLLRSGGIWREVPAGSIFDTIGKVIAALPALTPPVRQLLTQRLNAEGGITWAPVGGGFALPHLSTLVALGRQSGTVALLLLRDPLPQTGAAPDEIPITRLIFFIAPSPRAHLDLLARLARALGQGQLRETILNGGSDAEIFAAAGMADKPGAKR